MARRKKSTFERLRDWNQLNRRERRQLQKRLLSPDPGLEVVHRNAAGIDVGSQSHYVAVPPDRDPRPVREFGSWTVGLFDMADWLRKCGIETVALQATGVYWIILYDVLVQHGLRVTVVNAVYSKNVPGRKSDVQECQWLMKLHTYGLLPDSFHLPPTLEKVRTLWRLRSRHIEAASQAIQHMQKALTKMNVQLANTLSDISGVSGQAIIGAILEGERDPYRLADLCQPQVKASREEVARSLEGHWREDVLFELRQAVDHYRFLHVQIQECDGMLQQYLAELPTRPVPVPARVEDAAEEEAEASEPVARKKKTVRKRKSGNAPHFDLHAELVRISGVDLTRIEGINVMTAQTILAELGPDLSAFKTEHHFTSWLGLCPNKNITGGKVIGRARKKVRNRVAVALRTAATTLKDSQSYLGARYRHLQRCLPLKIAATKAMARYLAILVYRMLKYGQDWVDQGAAQFESQREKRELEQLKRRAAARGLQLVPAQAQ